MNVNIIYIYIHMFLLYVKSTVLILHSGHIKEEMMADKIFISISLYPTALDSQCFSVDVVGSAGHNDGGLFASGEVIGTH